MKTPEYIEIHFEQVKDNGETSYKNFHLEKYSELLGFLFPVRFSKKHYRYHYYRVREIEGHKLVLEKSKLRED